MELDRAYADCAKITRREAKNFYYAFLCLPRRQRRAVYVLYAFCRESDDAADVAAPSSSLAEKREGLRQLRGRLQAAGEGRPETERDLALADVVARFGVDVADLAAVLDGVEMDLDLAQIETEEELDAYCDRVASAVGLATLPILTDGVPPTDEMREDAVHLGRGMQYVNILRDVAEDLERGRIYLPRERLAQLGVDAEALRRTAVTAPIRALLEEHAGRARAELAAGRRLLPHVSRRSRSCLWLLSEIYSRILRRIVDADYDVFAGRVSLSTFEKLWLLASALWRRR